MAEGLDEIGAVPGLGLRRIGLEDAGREPERLPDRHGGETHVVGPVELVDLDRVPHGLERLEIGEDHVGIFARNLSEEIVRHYRIERLAALADPEVHRAPEILGSPCPDAGLVVGGDVGRNDNAEGRRNGEPAGKGDALGSAPPTAPSRPEPAVWHETQSPARARYSPRLTGSSGEAARAVATDATPSAIASAVAPATPFLRDPKRSSPPRAGLLVRVAAIRRLSSYSSGSPSSG